jgi:pimeloyl-ACP methyl ester carboxylesterase
VRGSVGRRILGLGLAVAVVAVTVPTTTRSASAAPGPSSVRWSSCYKALGAEFGVTYECATVNVPLDYAAANGAVVQLAVVRLPATDPAAKIGSILLNPGGPGGSGVDFALFFGPAVGSIWGADVRARFDIVGFDPRGIGRSTAIKCFGNEKQSVQVFAPFAFPLTAEEEALVAQGDKLLADQCAQRGNKISDHMSTANVARDMDLLRQAVGDEQLTYVGLSYGSYLGVTYANLFPDRVRSVVVDGVLDPVAWANVEGAVPFSTRLRSDQGAQKTLERLFELCELAAPGNCALAPNAADRFAALADRLRAEPVLVTDPVTGEQFFVTYQDLIGLTLGTLYDPFAYADFAALLAALEAFATPAAIGSALARLEATTGLVNKRGFPHYVNFAEGFPAVACEDGNNPTDYKIWSTQGAAADEAFGYFGRIWTWASSPCAQWPLDDPGRYLGPFNADTANPVLVIGNLYDPATRYEGAQTVRALLPNSALLTVDVPGHTSLGASACAGVLTGQYLLDPGFGSTLDGRVCPVEFNPFDLVPGAAVSAKNLFPELRTALMSKLAYQPMR